MNASQKHGIHDEVAADVAVIGGGIIGLSIALEMHARGASVVVLERGVAMQQASIAAAGMLAVNDPGNPPELLPFSQMSSQQYPAFLRKVEALSNLEVPFQTEAVLQSGAGADVTRLDERSIDPRQLAAALLGAIRAADIPLLEGFTVQAVDHRPGELKISSSSGLVVRAVQVVSATGAWNAPGSHVAGLLIPRKGQMLRVRMPVGFDLRTVHRNEHVYIVPRRFGPQAGTALIGATIEDAGFDVSVHAADLARLRAHAAELVPKLGSETAAPMVEAWAGLRPATRDGLPLIGPIGANQFVASGHYRNGVLLAPATSIVIADLLTGASPAIDLNSFSPNRFD